MERTISPTKTYVAMFVRDEPSGYFFIKFTLPEKCENDSYKAAWYILNHINLQAYLLGCITFEDYSNIKEL